MIRFVVFDFDGVFTDGKCYFSGGQILKYYDIKDGKAIGMLRENNIIVGLISSYKTEKNVMINDIQLEEITTHLKFDKVSIGSRNKMNILRNWLDEMDITLDEVAYIGDDLADLEILKTVGFSACPNDAISECKEVVDYVCKCNGGDGCVREFVSYILKAQENITRAEIVIREIRKELNYQLNHFNVDDIYQVCDSIRECRGNVYFTGIGKSKNVAMECCILLKSINIKAFMLDAIECLHGDIGTIRPEDLIIMYSKSGNTIELINLIEVLKYKECKTIGVCCDSNSIFEKKCTHTIQLPFNSEIQGNIDKIPTNSYMSQLLFSNILVSLLKEDIKLSEYKVNHLGGSIGKHLESLGRYIVYKYPKFVLNEENTEINLNTVLLQMTNNKIGCSFFVDNNNILLGILTDGDIRRLLIDNRDISMIGLDNLNRDYYSETNTNKYVCECKKISYLPILNHERMLIGVCDLTK